MHEVDMTKCLLLSLQEWKLQHAPRVPVVEVVHLQVGDFTCVEPDALRFTYAAVVQTTWLAGSELRIERIPLQARCVVCQATYSPNPQQAYQSPCCNHPMEEILSGRELKIRSIDYGFPDAADPAQSAPDGTASPSLRSSPRQQAEAIVPEPCPVA
ncbi:hydrogenase maturation nickel metallochaperone HypA [Synechococcus sp. CBW1002]|jgi:hydrogenase nickel incorporation protein HypA/HybF|uniref:hydrogenase maturation nickel metallochaperone HypA/HybF n=1 Tax=Synechococcus sp. CBW1002 TaxID=1353134 RepID=UPI0018CCED85|nr:hydrogenase maturation nickel metallochaperone HypA [Synechococcus sp. CBW1002]QPN59838.1 hydrogenase maturation nickel metallochaperone HypA [Synechococcus sp. CBW1002]